MSEVALNIRTQGLFKGRQILEGRPRTPDLRRFLRRDTPGEVYKRRYSIWKDQLELGLKTDCGMEMKRICGLGDIPFLYVAIREETVQSGRKPEIPTKRKVLYGWAKEKDWGIMARARIYYVISEKAPGKAWEVLEEPIPLGKLTEQQETKRLAKLTIQAMTQGIGKIPLRRSWDVLHTESSDSYVVRIRHQGKSYQIFGFEGYSQVFSLIFEDTAKKQIIALFYPDQETALASFSVSSGQVSRDLRNHHCSAQLPQIMAKESSGLIKAAILSEKKNGVWTPLESPEIIYTTPECSAQHQRLVNRITKLFLLEDKEESEFLDLKPLPILEGSVRLRVDYSTEEKAIGDLNLSGYSDYEGKKIYGRIIVEGDEKKVYFWPDDKSRQDTTTPPIKPEGHVAAQKIDGQWEINWHAMNTQEKAQREAAIKYGNYLFATILQQDREFHIPWHAWTNQEYVYITTRTQRVYLPISDSINPQEVYSVTRQIQKRFKFVEFWENQQAYAANENPFAVRFITLRSNGKWDWFWSRLDDQAKFMALIREGTVSPDELSRIFNNPWIRKYPEASWLAPSDQMGTSLNMVNRR